MGKKVIIYIMKKLISLIFSLLFFYPVTAQNIDQKLDDVLQAQTNKAHLSIQKKPYVVLDPIIKDLQNEPLTRLSWQDFLTRNQHAKEVEMASLRVDNQASLLGAQQIDGSLMDFMNVETQVPPYEQMAKGQRFVFIAEAVNHETPDAINEAAAIIQAVRKANPEARILLASEFLVWMGDPQCSLLQKADEKPCLAALPPYAPVFKSAQKAGVDMLALDDFICMHYLDNYSGVKIGKFVVFVNPKDKVPSLNLSQDPQDDLLLSAEQLIAVSPWGARERTHQWARRIKALQPFYDIILVHAGDGHINTTYSLDLAPMLKIKNYLLITLVPFKELPPDVAQEYEHRAEITEQYNWEPNTAYSAEEQKTFEQLTEKKIGSEKWKKKDSPTVQKLWIYSDMGKIMQEYQQSKELQRLNKLLPYSTRNVLTVLLK